jgi:hypothetical protein
MSSQSVSKNLLNFKIDLAFSVISAATTTQYLCLTNSIASFGFQNSKILTDFSAQREVFKTPLSFDGEGL